MESSRELRSIGMNIFINHYELLLKLNNVELLKEYFIKNEISNAAGAAIRASYAMQVIKDKEKHKQCLEYIAFHAKKTTAAAKIKAKTYLERLACA